MPESNNPTGREAPTVELMELVRRIGLARFDEGYGDGRRNSGDRDGARDTAVRLEGELREAIERLAGYRIPGAAEGCRKCGGAMKPSKATGQTFSTSDEGTCSPAGPGALIDCMKCELCGWSVAAPPTGAAEGTKADQPKAADGAKESNDAA